MLEGRQASSTSRPGTGPAKGAASVGTPGRAPAAAGAGAATAAAAMPANSGSGAGGGAAPGGGHSPASFSEERRGSRRGAQHGSGSPRSAPVEPQYTVYVRLPLNRNGFVDPPRVDWDASKERLLWRTLSRGSRNTDIDWDSLSAHLQVSRPFLLQQAAWIYERQLSQIQAQMRKDGPVNLNSTGVFPPPPSPPGPPTPAVPTVLPSPARPPPPTAPGLAAGSPLPRAMSAVSLRSGGSGAPSTPRAGPGAGASPTPPQQQQQQQRQQRQQQQQQRRASLEQPSRTGLVTDADISAEPAAAPRPLRSRHTTPSETTHERRSTLRFPHSPPAAAHVDPNSAPPPPPPPPPLPREPSAVESTASSSDDGEGQPSRHHRHARLPAFLRKRFTVGPDGNDDGDDGDDGDDDDDDDDGDDGDEEAPAFLPFAALSVATAAAAATGDRSTGSMMGTVTLQRPSAGTPPANTAPAGPAAATGQVNGAPGAMGSLRTLDDEDRPSSSFRRARGGGSSSAAPRPSSSSMGSSFSDLSDASVSQSAMEEAYLSTLQAGGGGGGLGSRISFLGRAMGGGGGGGGSRYFNSNPSSSQHPQ